MGRVSKVHVALECGSSRVPGKFLKIIFSFTLKIRTSGNQTLECFIATLPTSFYIRVLILLSLIITVYLLLRQMAARHATMQTVIYTAIQKLKTHWPLCGQNLFSDKMR